MKNDILITGGNGYIGKFFKDYIKYEGDINDYALLYEQSCGTKGIVHLAAKVGWQTCESNYKQCIFSNVLGLINILEVAKDLKLWVLFASTYQVEECQLYGITKLMGEELCRLYKKNHNVNVTILRFPSIYGPDDRPFKVVTSYINRLKKGIDIEIKDDKKLRLTYIKDIVKIIENEVRVLQGKKVFGGKLSLTQLKEGIKKCLKEK